MSSPELPTHVITTLRHAQTIQVGHDWVTVLAQALPAILTAVISIVAIRSTRRQSDRAIEITNEQNKALREMQRVQLEHSARQLQHAEEKLKLELFEERYKVWSAIDEAVKKWIEDPDLPAVIVGNFTAAMNRSYFLFNDEIESLLTRIGEALEEASAHRRRFKEIWRKTIRTEEEEQEMMAEDTKCRKSLEIVAEHKVSLAKEVRKYLRPEIV